MFIVSMKMSRKKIVACITGVVAVVAAVVVLTVSGLGKTAETGERVSNVIKETSDVAAFLKNFGWETSSEPCEMEDVMIPTEFNDVYTQYNEMQKQQGFNLEEYRGECAKRIAYEVTNYPGQEENVRANVLVYDGKVIGGDICSIESDGFIQGFERAEEQDT